MEVSTQQANKKLLTRYFYKDNSLCFQILLNANENTSLLGEFSNYSEYRKSFTSLHSQIENNGTIIDNNAQRDRAA